MPHKPVTTPRKLPRQDRSRVTVEAILEATTRILVEEGYDKANTNRIAERAGISIGSLYQYFPNKESLMTALGRWRDVIRPQNIELTVFLLSRTVHTLCHSAVIEHPSLVVDKQFEREVSDLLLSYLTRDRVAVEPKPDSSLARELPNPDF